MKSAEKRRSSGATNGAQVLNGEGARMGYAAVATLVATDPPEPPGPKQSPARGGALQGLREIAAAGLEPATRGL